MLCLVCGAEMMLVEVAKDTSLSGYQHHTWRCSACPAVERRIDIQSGENAPPMQSDPTKRAPSILCLECGGEMSLVQVVQDTAMFVPGYEHHTWRCSHCSRVEKRMTFTRIPTQVSPSEASRTVPVELTEMAAEAMQTIPGDLIPVGMLQTAVVGTSHQEPTGAMRRSALAEKLRAQRLSRLARATARKRQFRRAAVPAPAPRQGHQRRRRLWQCVVRASFEIFSFKTSDYAEPSDSCTHRALHRLSPF
jgi:hypothetical protein